MQKNLSVLSMLLLLALGISSHLSAASFEVLFPADYAYGAKSILVSDDGSTVLSVYDGIRDLDMYLWKQSQGIVQTYPRIGSSVPISMSGNGQTVFTNTYPDPLFIDDASYDGSVRVGALSAYSNSKAIAIINGQLQDLGKLAPTDTAVGAWSVSADGKTVVGVSMGTSREAFRWTEATGMLRLGTLPGATQRSSTALSISPAGDAIVGTSASGNSGEEPFLWTAGNGMQPLGDLPGGFYSSDAYAVSNGGNLVVGQSFAEHGTEAFLWDSAHGMRSLTDALANEYHLDLHGLKLINATDISASGNVIVGWGVDATRTAFAFRVNLVPEPSTLLLLTGASSILAFSRSRRAAIPDA